ncbi:hypothetical protein CPB83DRAFT_847650 [Crepidotus variabilis]|uniref:AMP-dependent synthetase/ligase domain-containing protein n=1 Tax=Crepidotus variabilis TaxID=179855 RepID=A0A9P6JU01_9AGAR|nr:hypothetical protein CPB83DRAFT_847650 [Crepidotus variabilis]
MPLVNEKIVAWPAVKPYDKQAVPVPGTKRPGETAHYRNGIWGLIDEHTPNTLSTVDQIFNDGLKAGKDVPFLGERKLISTNPLKYATAYTWITYGEADLRRRYIGSALHTLFQKGELGGGELPTVGIWSMNRPEWQLVDIATAAYQKVSVSLYDTLGNDSVEYIINHAHTTVIFSTSDHIPTLIKGKVKLPNLKMIVCIDKVSRDASKLLGQWSHSQGVIFKEFAEFEAYGKANLTDPIPAHPDQIVSICYTSGTTNVPKGALLKHKNLALATQNNMYGLELPEHATLLSYLPLAHIYERFCELATMAIGGKIGYFTGDPLRLLEDAQILKPNFFPSVPRVLNRIYQAAMAGGNVPGLKGKLFNKAVQTKLEKLNATGETTHALWDRLVFRKIQAVIGGQLALVSTGSAPISPDVLNFLKIAFSCDVIEGYGLTETAATCARTWPGDSTASGTVGPPGPTNEVKLVDVPAMGYTSEDKPNPRGELCIRGANCFSAYYKDEKNTKEAVDSEGWVHTGDVAEIDSVGRVKIVDRVKNIMKLAQGEYVALEKIENTYTALPIIAQIYIHGDSLQSFLVAVIIPDPVQLSSIASKVLGKRISPTDASALAAACEDPAINKHVMSILINNARQNGLKGFETVKRLHLSMVPFSIETNTLTPTLKVRRKDAYQFYKKEIDALYTLGESSKL